MVKEIKLLALLFLYNSICISATLKYGDRAVIYRVSGSAYHFLYAKYYEKSDSLIIGDDKNYNSENDASWWTLVNPDDPNTSAKIKYGDKVMLLIQVNNKDYGLHASSEKTKIQKKRKKKDNRIIDSYYKIETAIKDEMDKEQVKALGTFIIKNPLRIESTNQINNTNPVILQPLNNLEEDVYLEARVTVGKNPANWYIKTRTDTK